MANKLHISDASTISVDTLVLTNKAGTGSCVISAPSGQSYQMVGSRMGYENLSSSRSMDISESNTVWTNTGVGAITVVLPSGAPNGVKETILRTGGVITVDPGTTARIWHIASGIWDDIAAKALMASSGSKLSLISDGSAGWYSEYYDGTITQ